MLSRKGNIPIAPITEKDLLEAREQDRQLAELYLTQIPDFVKWTSTVAVAAILWVGNKLGSVIGLSWAISIVSLVFLVGSLVIGVFAVRRVVAAWAREWDVAREDYNLCVLKKWKTFKEREATGTKSAELDEIERKEKEQINHLVKAIGVARPYSEARGFSILVSLHIGSLTAGLLAYILAQILGASYY
jgi:hypothetical protein